MTGILERLRAFQFAPAFAIAAIAAGIAFLLGPARHPAATPTSFDPALAAAPPESLGAFASRLVGTLTDASVHHVEAGKSVKPHFHRTHDEVVMILEGTGTMHIGDSSYALAPGATFLVPRGVIHSVETGGTPLRAITVFAPPFDGKDRIFVP
jgi:quercetin dioxygenase-like cupin family protein